MPSCSCPTSIRVTPTNCCLGYDSTGSRRRPTFLQTLVRCVVTLFLTVVVVLFIGAEVQRGKTQNAPSTAGFYTTPKVCGLVLSSSDEGSIENGTLVVPQPIGDEDSEGGNETSRQGGIHAETFEDVSFAQNRTGSSSHQEVIIAHCGDCGHCSNPHDVTIYDDTRNSLTDVAKSCAMRSLIWGRKTARLCLERKVGFTPDCQECWVENIMCDLNFCLFVCTWNTIFGRIHSHEDGKEVLNPCTECDEKRCGPEFISCAGANRRRTGIISDIFRDDENEVCKVVDKGWWNRDGLVDDWREAGGENGGWTAPSLLSRSNGNV